MSHFDVIVVGLGAMGSAASFHLAKQGIHVLGLDQFGVPHAMGSSHGDSRMIRLCYYEHPDYVPLLKRAYQLWHELESESKQQILYLTGGLYMGRPDSDLVAGTLRAARDHDLKHQLLDRPELAKRYPQFHVPQDFVGVIEPNAGFLLPERAIAAHAELAIKHGAKLHGFEKVIDWNVQGNVVQVQTNRDQYSANRIIFCGGAWSEQLLGEIGVNLTVTRQVLGWVWPNNHSQFELGALPVWGIDLPDGSLFYGFPMHSHTPAGGRAGFKIAHHFHGEITNPDTINRLPEREDENDFRPLLKQYIPDADGDLLSMAVCMYTNSPDSHFIIDHHPCAENGNITIACGFSGHGFKFASVLGEALADLATRGRTQLPIGFLGLKRFTSKPVSG